MFEDTGSIGQTVLNTLTQRTQQNFKLADTNESGGLDKNEVQVRAKKQVKDKKSSIILSPLTRMEPVN